MTQPADLASRLQAAEDALRGLNHRHANLLTYARALQDDIYKALATPEHRKIERAGLPFCSCGLSLSGGDATWTWIRHRLDDIVRLIHPDPTLTEPGAPPRSPIRTAYDKGWRDRDALNTQDPIEPGPAVNNWWPDAWKPPA